MEQQEQKEQKERKEAEEKTKNDQKQLQAEEEAENENDGIEEKTKEKKTTTTTKPKEEGGKGYKKIESKQKENKNKEKEKVVDNKKENFKVERLELPPPTTWRGAEVGTETEERKKQEEKYERMYTKTDNNLDDVFTQESTSGKIYWLFVTISVLILALFLYIKRILTPRQFGMILIFTCLTNVILLL